VKVVHPLWRLRSGLTGTLVLFLSSITAHRLQSSRQTSRSKATPKTPAPRTSPTGSARSTCCRARPPIPGARGLKPGAGDKQAAIYLSDGTPPPGAALTERDGVGSGSGYDLNFENAPVATVAKVILGDVLGVGYTIDPRVQGTITMASVRPIAKADALYVLEKCAAHVQRGAGARSRRRIPAAAGQRSRRRQRRRAGTAEAGQGISVVPLRYVSAQTVFKLLDAFASRPRPFGPIPGATP